MEFKPKVCFHREWEFATFRMEFKKIHKVEVKVKSICTKKINEFFFENVDMVHEWIRKKHIHIIHHGLNFKGVTTILLIWYSINGNGNYIKVTNFQNFQVNPKIFKLRISLFCELIIPSYELWFKSFEIQSYDPWKEFFNDAS